MTVAEIGSGWGSLAIHMASATGARVVAINVSPEQIHVARERAAAAGVGGLVEFRELDYRALDGRFDRVVSVGMMEHVGIGNSTPTSARSAAARPRTAMPSSTASAACCRRAAPGPSSASTSSQAPTCPHCRRSSPSTERQALWVADMEVLRLHYHHTLRHWRERFAANRALAAALYDERFCRMWEYYLAAVDVGFLNGSNMVFQLAALGAGRRGADRARLHGAAAVAGVERIASGATMGRRQFGPFPGLTSKVPNGRVFRVLSALAPNLTA